MSKVYTWRHVGYTTGPCSKLFITPRQPVNQQRYGPVAAMIMQHWVRLIGVTTSDHNHPFYLFTTAEDQGINRHIFPAVVYGCETWSLFCGISTNYKRIKMLRKLLHPKKMKST
jgi:hypothetical protein